MFTIEKSREILAGGARRRQVFTGSFEEGLIKQDSYEKDKILFDREKSFGDTDDSLKAVAKDLLTKSSIYAVSQLVTSTGFVRKALWFIVLCIGLIGCFYESYRFLSLYFQYPVVTTLGVENNFKIDFPAVTVCNLNRLPVRNYMCLFTNKTSRCGFSRKYNIPISERWRYASCSNDILSEERNESRIFLRGYLQSPRNKRKLLGYRFKDLIKECTFDGEPCSDNSFTDFSSLQFGNCFTFNRKKDKDSSFLETAHIGSNSGLELTLNLDVFNYSPISYSIGARVELHGPDVEPNPEYYGINISPGFETSLAVKQTAYFRLENPYRDKCKNYDSWHFQNQEECLKFRLQDQTYNHCGCIDPFLSTNYSAPPCDIENQTSVCCMDEVKKLWSHDYFQCPLPCKSIEYEFTISLAEWPSEWYYKKFMMDKNENVLIKSSYETKKQEMAKLKVYYKTLEMTYYKQEPMFQDSELFSQLGGQLGLWLGVSLVALFECIENISHLLHHCIKKTEWKVKNVHCTNYQKEAFERITSV
ncbi:acid-sensing ion channel 5-like [Uloborus diversus]|uniref:acid-sensing ion channel 5-like n=1 Tax=Uloborus diversus TaxID=327109 RepID=UPI002409320C|nr:acid-sensing ion channel 5-like [Uloborus diversus]